MEKKQGSASSGIRIRVLELAFDDRLQRREIPALRGAVVNGVGREKVLFHNHLGSQFRYGYPLIQYKSINGRPTLLSLESGVEESIGLLQINDLSLNINGRTICSEMRSISYDYFVCDFSESLISYAISNWFALNESNYSKYIDLSNEADRFSFLESILVGNIITLAKGLHWNLMHRVQVSLIRMYRERTFKFKNLRMLGFDLMFKTNVILPNHIGLGKSVARGFGVIQRLTRKFSADQG